MGGFLTDTDVLRARSLSQVPDRGRSVRAYCYVLFMSGSGQAGLLTNVHPQ